MQEVSVEYVYDSALLSIIRSLILTQSDLLSLLFDQALALSVVAVRYVQRVCTISPTLACYYSAWKSVLTGALLHSPTGSLTTGKGNRCEHSYGFLSLDFDLMWFLNNIGLFLRTQSLYMRK